MPTNYHENINICANNMSAIIQSNQVFNASVLPILKEISALGIDLAIEDLKKGNYLGNRKLDINLALNIQGITQDMLDDDSVDAKAIWTDASQIVFYDKATVLFTDNVAIEVPFLFDGNPVNISTHSELLLQFSQNAALQAKLEATLMGAFTANVVGEFVRVYDLTNDPSKIERITLNAVSGNYKSQNPIYTWADTTSALQVIAMRQTDLVKIGNNIDRIISLINKIEEVLEIQTKLPELVGEAGDITIYNKLSELMETHAQLTAIVTVYNDIKAGGNNYINSVGADLQLGVDSEIKKVNANKTNIDAVNANKDNIDTNAENADAINTVATDLDLGASSKIKINADNINQIVAVALELAKVIATANNETNINKNANNEDNINTVAVNILDVIANAENMTDIKNALNYANTASQKAEEAIQARNQIIGLNVSAQTLASNQLATVAYDSLIGLLTFGIPQGPKGDRGDPYEPDARGLYANRSLYDNELKDFSYLAYDVEINGEIVPQLYFKNSNDPADWSVGSSFGRGPTGTGIESNLFTSTTDASGVEGVAGATDTYTITYTDGSTSTWIKKNGIVPTKADLGLENVDNTSDLNKPISNATQTALNLKANTTDVNTALNTKLNKSAVLPVLTSTDDASALSASQGKVLKDLIDAITIAIYSDDADLDTMQEQADKINLLASGLDSLAIANIAGLVDALAAKANSTDVNTALVGKQSTLVSGVNVKTLNGNSLLGSGNIAITFDTLETVIAKGLYSGITSMTFNDASLASFDEIKLRISAEVYDSSDAWWYLRLNNLSGFNYKWQCISAEKNGTYTNYDTSDTQIAIPRFEHTGIFEISIRKQGYVAINRIAQQDSGKIIQGSGCLLSPSDSISNIYLYDIPSTCSGFYSLTGVNYV